MSRRVSLLGCILIMAVFLFGCNSDRNKWKDSVSAKSEQEVVIPVVFLMNTQSGVKANEKLVLEFNEAYKGKYYVEVEWMAGDEEDYRSKMKLLNSINKLPAIITDVGIDPAFYELLKNNNRIVNMAPYIERDPALKEFYQRKSIQSCVEADGSIYLAPLDDKLYYSGVFYNKDLFKKAGIHSFPNTWEEFFAACDKLTKAGITPLSLHTTGTAWIPMLYSTASMGMTQSGQEFMNEVFPETYNTAEFRDMLALCKKLFQYTTPDAIDGDFDTAAWHFYEEETAMIANGAWMIDNFTNLSFVDDDFKDKIGFHTFPGDVIVGSPEMTAWVVSADYNDEVIEGAMEFLKFRLIQTEKLSNDLQNDTIEDYEKIVKQYLEEINQAKKIIPNYQLKWNTIIQHNVFLNDLPKFLRGTLTMDEFIDTMDLAVKQYENERNRNEGGEE